MASCKNLKHCSICDSYSVNTVEFYNTIICEDCIEDIKGFEIDFNTYTESVDPDNL